MRFLVAVLAAVALAAPGIAEASGGMLVGAAEDAAKSPDPFVAKAKMDLARLVGMDAVRVTANWTPGKTAPTSGELLPLRNAVAAADLDGIEVILSVFQPGSATTPLTPQARADFARYVAALATALPSVRRIIVGNEPNLNRFWMPQFSAEGRGGSPTAYEALLAQAYDALKAVSKDIVVIGGALAPRGQDNPRAKRQTHSPTAFIAGLGAAYRATGRTRPIMDVFAFHPYEDNSSLPPSFEHPRSTTIAIGDYDKLTQLLGQAFGGTAQAGSTLPILYDEFGVESSIPPSKVRFYDGSEPRTTRPVPEGRQGDYYQQALALAACQPNVIGILIFHVSDEVSLDRWQSGVFYSDDSPKASLGPLQAAVASLRAGTLGACASAGAGSDASSRSRARRLVSGE